jgi:hypothetical protein
LASTPSFLSSLSPSTSILLPLPSPDSDFTLVSLVLSSFESLLLLPLEPGLSLESLSLSPSSLDSASGSGISLLTFSDLSLSSLDLVVLSVVVVGVVVESS